MVRTMQHQVIPLHKLPRDKGVKIYDKTISDGSTFLVFHHTDGMYSYCETEKGGPIHLHVSTPLIPYKDGYRVVQEEDGIDLSKHPDYGGEK